MTLEEKNAAIVHRSRKFWRVASTFPPNKEDVYPEHAIAQEFDSLPANSLVLEYGCGGGSDALSFLRRGHRVVAVDINPNNIASTGARIRDTDALGYHERYATWLLLKSDEIQPLASAMGEGETGMPAASPTVNDVASREVLDLALDGSLKDGNLFDVASSHGVLHHIPQPLVGRVVAEVFRLLKPGGRFYAMLYTPQLERSHAGAMNDLMKKYALSPEEAFGWCTDGEGCPWAEAYSDSKARALFEGAGFEVVSVFEYHEGFFKTFRLMKPEGATKAKKRS